MLSVDRVKENGRYMTYHFSRVINISNTRKVMLSFISVNSTKCKGGKGVGQEILYIFDYKGNEWVLSDKKSIAIY
ncbi:hypothetical protein GCM10022258_44700 [Aquimarina gracilis]